MWVTPPPFCPLCSLQPCAAPKQQRLSQGSIQQRQTKKAETLNSPIGLLSFTNI